MPAFRSIRPLAAIAFVTGSLATAAQAEPYVGISAGQARWEECYAPLDCDRTDTAWAARAGYNFLPWLGVEARYVDLGSVAANTAFALPPANEPVGLAMSAKGAGINAVATLPIGERFALSAIAGVARMELDPEFRTPGTLVVASGLYDGKRRSTEPYYGLRASWALSPRMELSLEGERYRLAYESVEQDATLIAAGFTYRFR